MAGGESDDGGRCCGDADGGGALLVKQCAIFAMTFGPAAAWASYIVLVGWYEAFYHSKDIVLWMRCAILLPYPFFVLFRRTAVRELEARCGLRVAYFCQLTLMQLAVAALLV
eukprot:TRINITY_DN26599_c0_g1_i3.p3 TRINITY_DN26599_c0_g1~~TRINITY_DN26599_c0_g1_i3.p3  ORF type:complete len:112 (-),score=29.60 TRINITY_DN26599_c0_g1_i3:35-370(-)